MRIGIDVDSTLADLAMAVCWVHYKQCSLDDSYQMMIPADWSTWEWTGMLDKFGLTRERMFNMMDVAWREWQIFMQPKEKRLDETLGQAIEKGHQILITTTRSVKSHMDVATWLTAFGIPYQGLFFVPSGMSKFEMPIDILIDDAPKYAEQIVDYPSQKMYLIDSPWNQDVQENSQVARVKSIKEALNFIEMDFRAS